MSDTKQPPSSAANILKSLTDMNALKEVQEEVYRLKQDAQKEVDVAERALGCAQAKLDEATSLHDAIGSLITILHYHP